MEFKTPSPEEIDALAKQQKKDYDALVEETKTGLGSPVKEEPLTHDERFKRDKIRVQEELAHEELKTDLMTPIREKVDEEMAALDKKEAVEAQFPFQNVGMGRETEAADAVDTSALGLKAESEEDNSSAADGAEAEPVTA